MTALSLVPDAQVTLGDAIDAYLDSLAPVAAVTTRKEYASILGRLGAAIGERDVADVTGNDLAAWLTAGFADRAPATWNLSRVAVRSAWAYFTACGWTDGTAAASLPKRKIPQDRDRAIPADVLDQLLAAPFVPLRERTLWRLLFESAARVSEVLRLNVTDLDQVNRRAQVCRKGGATDVVTWLTGTAVLLPRMLKGRRTGPVFVTRPRHFAAIADTAPNGTTRLSYRQAEALFRDATAGLPGGPFTLHQLRHSALTQAAEQGASTPMMLALSGHTSARSLVRYARVSPDALAAWQAERDPARRR